jgi:hypothetical protein
VDREEIVTALRRLAAGEHVAVAGPVAVDVRGSHEWATNVTIERTDTVQFLSWHGGHHHVNRINGRLTLVGDALQVPTPDHRLVVVRPIGPQDTWKVFPANVTAWEAVQQGIR